MADKVSYPQIPSTVWWGVRSILQRSPGATLDERTLSIQLGVQEAAARQYIAELRRVGILNDDCKATPLAQKWRHDETYQEAVSEILARIYPQSLIQVAPPGEAERQKVISWFSREGLGSGTAGNKAATYLMISSAQPNEAPARGGGASKNDGRKERGAATPATAQRAEKQEHKPREGIKESPLSQVPLNLNIQIHISADATGKQIESIFSAMRRYLYDGAD